MVGIVFALVSGLTFALVGGFTSDELVVGLVEGLTVGLAFGLAFGPAVGLAASGAWPVSLAAAQMAIKWHTPMHLMRFLNDAHNRNVLRTVGPVYQFRHARLQDRLAAATNTVGLASETTGQSLKETAGLPLSD